MKRVAPVQLRCQACGFLFWCRYRGRKYCTRACGRQYRSRVCEGHRPRREMPDAEALAEMVRLREAGWSYGRIGARFRLTGSQAAYQVTEVMGRWLPAVPLTCAECGVSFQAKAGVSALRFCGDACSLRRRRRLRKLPPPPKVRKPAPSDRPRQCRGCGRTFTARSNARFCGKPCGQHYRYEQRKKEA